MFAPRSGNVIAHFKEFEFGKQWAADFEILNDSNEPISYIGSSDKYRFAYCILAAKKQNADPVYAIHDYCRYGNSVSLSTLNPGQSTILAVDKGEIRALLYNNDASPSVTAQVGFEFFVGNDRHRFVVWTEQVTFPSQDHR